MRRAVETVGVFQRITADHRQHAAGVRIHRHQRALHLRDLLQRVAPVRAAHRINDRASGQTAFGVAPSALSGPLRIVICQTAGGAIFIGQRHCAASNARDHRTHPVRERRRPIGISQLRLHITRRVAACKWSAPFVAAVVIFKSSTQCARGRELQTRIDRGPDREAAAIERLLAVLFLHLPAHFLDEVRSGHVLVARQAVGDLQISGARFGGLFFVDVAPFEHAPDRVVAAVDRALAVARQLIIGRPLRQNGEIRRFRDRELAQRLVEIVERSGGDAIGAVTEIDLVQVKLEDAVLIEHALDALRDETFAQLGPHGAEQTADAARTFGGTASQHVAGDLLRDRGSALQAVALNDIERNAQHGARKALIIKTGVFEETRVFNRDEGVLHVIGNLFDRHEHALLARELSDERAIASINAARDRRFVILQIGERRQPLQRGDDEADHRQKADADQRTEADQQLAPWETAAGLIVAAVVIMAAPAAVVVGIVSQHYAPLLARSNFRAGVALFWGASKAAPGWVQALSRGADPSRRFAPFLGAGVKLRPGEIGIHRPGHRIGHPFPGARIGQASLIRHVRQEAGLDQHCRNIRRQQHEQPSVAVGIAQKRRNFAQTRDDCLRKLGGAVRGLALGEIDQDIVRDAAAGGVPDFEIPVLRRHQVLRPRRAAFRERINRGAGSFAIGVGIGVDRDEEVRILVAGEMHAVFQFHEPVGVSGERHLIIAPRFQGLAQLQCGVQHHIFFPHAGDAYSAGIASAMAGVDDNGAARGAAAGAFNAGRRGCERLGGGDIEHEFRRTPAADFLAHQLRRRFQIEH